MEKHLCRSLFVIKMMALVNLQYYYEKILTQESSLTMFKHAILWNTSRTPYYEAHQARYLMKQAKHVILWSTPNMPFYEARQARQCFEARKGTLFHEARQARKHPSTQARHLADSKNSINHIYARVSRIIYQYHNSLFRELLEKDTFLTTDQRNS